MESEKVFYLCYSEEDKSAELGAMLEASPGVDVNLFQNENGGRAIHAAVVRGNVACTRLLIDANADLDVRDENGGTALHFSCHCGNLELLRVLIDNKADVNTADIDGTTPAFKAANMGHSDMLSALLNAKADLNASNKYGSSPVLTACQEDHLSCLQLLVKHKADLFVKDNQGVDAVLAAMAVPLDYPSKRVPGISFAVLSCNTDSKNASMYKIFATQALVNTHIDEYKHIQSFIDEYHTVTEHALSENVVVDTRVGRGDHGLYHEPLEQVLLYLGLSMKTDQTVNASIDGKTGTRALIPGHPGNANLWFELYQRTHCSSCSARRAKLKKCPCDTTRYCNSDCQRKHWQTHKPIHKAAMLKKKKKK
jgi:hypothetical protein